MATNGTAPTTGDLLTVASGVARLSYFYGQLLTQRDLEAEQRYHLALRRLMQREAFGTGTVAGLGVESAGATAPESVFVRAGLAMDPDGRELLLVNDVSVTVSEAPAKKGTSYLKPPYDAKSLAHQLAKHWGASIGPDDIYNYKQPDAAALFTQLLDAGLTEVGDTSVVKANDFKSLANLLDQIHVPPDFALRPGQILRDYLFQALVGTTHLGLRYAERGTDPSPAVLDASCCGDASCFSSRREEGVVIVGQAHPFPAVPDPYRDARAALELQFLAEQNPPPKSPSSKTLHCQKDLCDYLLGAWHGLPPDDSCGHGALPVVPIARVYWSRYTRAKDPERILAVDNCSRPFAPGVPPVRALYDVLTQCTPSAPIKPRFDQISPKNHGELTPSQTLTSTKVTARATSLLKEPDTKTWEVYFYPAGSTSAPLHWHEGRQPKTGGFKFKIDAKIDPTSARVTTIDLTFEEATSNTPFDLPSGVYLWRMNLGGKIEARTSHAPLDTTPNPPAAVPSGGDDTIEPFEAVFYVS